MKFSHTADRSSHFVETWHAMESLVDSGLARSIGLSNFNLRQTKEIMDKARKHFPSVLQNESHPYLQEKDLRDFCRINKIVFQAYSALGSADRPWRVQVRKNKPIKLWIFFIKLKPNRVP